MLVVATATTATDAAAVARTHMMMANMVTDEAAATAATAAGTAHRDIATEHGARHPRRTIGPIETIETTGRISAEQGGVMMKDSCRVVMSKCIA